MKKQITNYYIITLILYVNIIAASDKPKTLVDNHQKVTIACMETKDCTKHLGDGYNCTNHSCVCLDEEVCGNKVNTPKARAIVNVIDEQCSDDDLCKVKDSHCNDGYCRCEAGKVASASKRRCLPISGGLDENCEEDIQCMSKEPNSICRDNKCVCNDIHNQDKFSCVPKVGLGGKCNSSVECSHIPMSVCELIYCECEHGFVPSEAKDQCLVIAKKQDDICEESVQCHQLYGKWAICRKNQCECDAVHTLVNNSSCPSRLKKFCDNDDECKTYVDDPRMYCSINRCECSPSYTEKDGICNGARMITCYSILVYLFFLVHHLF